jgi:spore maturation protein CgeB
MQLSDSDHGKAVGRRQGHAVLLCLADDYGNPESGASFEYETFLPVLRQFFDKVTVWPFDRLLLKHGYFRMNANLEAWVRHEAPDLLFCVPFENQVDWSMLANIRGSRTTTMAWMCDDQWRFEPFSRWLAPCFDFIATTDRAAYQRYLALEDVRPLLTQWACDPHRFRPIDAAPLHDVVFIGSRAPHRTRYIKALRRAGIRVHVRGRGWPEGRATSEELQITPAQSLISLNFANSCGQVKQLKARPFELAGTGTCVVTEYEPQLSSFFEVGEEVVVFRSRSDCVRTVKALLREPERARLIGKSGRHRVEREHTYADRLSLLLVAAGFPGTPNRSDGAVCVMS